MNQKTHLSLFSGWTKKYRLSKSLKFALKPVGKTKSFLNEFIPSDTQRDKDYRELKKIIDEYHKSHIEEVFLSTQNLFKKEDLKEFDSLWQNCMKNSRVSSSDSDTKDFKKDLEVLQKKLSKQVALHFKTQQKALVEGKSSGKSPLFQKELITEILPQWLQNLSYSDMSHREDLKSEQDFIQWKERSLHIVSQFNKFTTYLKGFHENRKNIYSDKVQATAIAHRIIHENGLRFLSNLKNYQKIAKFSDLKNQIDVIKLDFKEEFDWLKIKSVKELFDLETFNKVLSQKGIDTYNCIIRGKESKHKEVQGINKKINLFRQQLAKKHKDREENTVKLPHSQAKNIPSLQPLYKQILSDRQSHSFYYEDFKTREELLSALASFWKEISFPKSEHSQKKDSTSSVIQKIDQLFTEEMSKNTFDPDKIYFEGSRLSALSHKLFGDWSLISKTFNNYVEKAVDDQNKKLFSSKAKSDSWLKKDFFSFSEIHTALFFSENLEIEVPLSPSCLLFPILSLYAEGGGKSHNRDTKNSTIKTSSSKSHLHKESLFFSLREIQKALNWYSEEFGFPSGASNSENECNILSVYFKFSLLSLSSLLNDDLHTLFNDKDTHLLKLIKKLPDTKLFNFQNVYQALYAEKVPPSSLKIFFKTVVKTLVNTKKPCLDAHIRRLYQGIESLSRDTGAQGNSKLDFSKQETKAIQDFLQAFMDILHLLRPLKGNIKSGKTSNSFNLLDQDTNFYNELDPLYKSLQPVIPLFNKCRNFISRNENRLKKIKIVFNNAQFLDGWDVNKETAYRSVLLRKKVSPSSHLTDNVDAKPSAKGKNRVDNSSFQKATFHKRDQKTLLPSDETEAEAQYNYYLAVIKQDHKDLFNYHLNFDDVTKSTTDKIKDKKSTLKENILCQDNRDHYEKINYKFLPGPDKMLPKVFFSQKNLDLFNPSDEIVRIKQKKTYAKQDGERFSLSDCHKLIDFYKESIKKHHDWKQFNFQFSPTKDYKDISDFYHEVDSQGYKLSFDKIRGDYIDEKIKQSELYLFQIYSKDFSLNKKSKGRDNLHTSYFKMLFDKRNLKDTVFKLSGGAEMFFRKASLKKKVTHPSNEAIKNKNPINHKKSSTFNYALIKDKRFTEDKFFLHLPIEMNFKSKDMRSTNFNQEVLKFLKSNRNINIIGIDRGERHLAYYTVINQERKILSQGSFNQIDTKYTNMVKGNQGKDQGEVQRKVQRKIQGEAQREVQEEVQGVLQEEVISRSVNYHKLLDKKERERDQSRKSWTQLDSIKNLKAGYLSQMVHKISRLMIDHNAIVVFEDLNIKFKRSRMKFEKQVYQKLEKALIDKLNYLVFKDKGFETLGGVLNAFQLSAPFESFQKMGKQTGFIFYVPAYYTSKVDPLTGFVDLIYPKYENVAKAKDFFQNFEKIYFDPKNKHFVFKYRDDKVNPSRKLQSQHCWTLCSQGSDRYRYDWKGKICKKINVTEELKELFGKYNIDYSKGKDLKQQIVAQDEKGFFLKLIKSLKLILQLRYINPEATNPNEKDFILSPVADPTGRFFDSRRVAKSDEPLPLNADANGAYHIALKGLQMVSNIAEDKKSKKFKTPHISNKDWFTFIRSCLSFRKTG